MFLWIVAFRITTQHISPLLVKAEMETVNQTRDIEGMQVGMAELLLGPWLS